MNTNINYDVDTWEVIKSYLKHNKINFYVCFFSCMNHGYDVHIKYMKIHTISWGLAKKGASDFITPHSYRLRPGPIYFLGRGAGAGASTSQTNEPLAGCYDDV